MRYTDEDKQRALMVMDANGGVVRKTARITGISTKTLTRWRDERERVPISSESSQLSEDDVEALMRLKHKLMETVDTMADSIEPAISEAPLTQRITGMIQLIDRVIRLGFEIASVYEVEDDGPDEIEGAETYERNDDEA